MKTKKLLAVWLCSLTLILLISPFTNAESIYSSVIRLHVLAESNTAEDQELKLFVRDKVLEYTESEFKNIDNLESAKEYVSKNLENIQITAKEAIKEKGFDYPVKVEFDYEYYPTRFYDVLSFPKGKYLSLKVIIGSGQGNNWWCVLFPPVCTNSALDSKSVLTDYNFGEENVKTVTKDGKRYEVKFKILEIISDLKEKFSF